MFDVNENAFYNLKDLAEGIGITIFTFRNWIKAGRLKASRVGKAYLISGRDLKAFLSTGTRTTPAGKTRKTRAKVRRK